MTDYLGPDSGPDYDPIFHPRPFPQDPGAPRGEDSKRRQLRAALRELCSTCWGQARPLPLDPDDLELLAEGRLYLELPTVPEFPDGWRPVGPRMLVQGIQDWGLVSVLSGAASAPVGQAWAVGAVDWVRVLTGADAAPIVRFFRRPR